MAITQTIVQASSRPIFLLPNRRRPSYSTLGHLGAGIIGIMEALVPRVRDDDSVSLQGAPTTAQWVLNTRLAAVVLLSCVSQAIVAEMWSAPWVTQMALAGCSLLALLNGRRLCSSAILTRGSTLQIQGELLVYKHLVFSLLAAQVVYLSLYLCAIAFYALV